MGRRLALLIANSDYQDTKLARLVAPSIDIDRLAKVLAMPDIGAFDDVKTLTNEPSSSVRKEVAIFFGLEKRADDLLLFYFSGHGVRDDQGALYFAVHDTDSQWLAATAIPATFITNVMDQGRSKRVVLILDCCHSGAFAQGAKAATGESAGTASAFEGRGSGHVVLTATDATQYAFEGDTVLGQAQASVFTHHLIEGLHSGAADLDADGKVTVDDLYGYVYDQVVKETPRQTPLRFTYKQQGDFVIALNRNPVVKPAELPKELQDSIESPIPWVRLGAVAELDRWLRGGDPRRALAAKEALLKMTDDDSRRVADEASKTLAPVLEEEERKRTEEEERRRAEAEKRGRREEEERRRAEAEEREKREEEERRRAEAEEREKREEEERRGAEAEERKRREDVAPSVRPSVTIPGWLIRTRQRGDKEQERKRRAKEERRQAEAERKTSEGVAAPVRRGAAGWLWVAAVVLVVLWILLFFIAHVGGLSHLLLLIALIVIVYNLLRK